MAAFHYTLTLTGSAQRLDSVVTAGVPVPTGHFLSIQADAANTGVVYVGGVSQTVSSSAYGWRIEIPASSIPAAPSIIELGGSAGVNLGDYQVIGTASDKLHILIAQ